jgi:threonine dehydrogenase-like Zn-dependent dehydrogenase
MLISNIISYSRDIYDGTRKYPFPTPLVIGTSGVGRLAAIGPDAVLLKPGQLIFVDSFIRGRDDPSAAFLFGVHEGYTEGSKKLMRGEWKDATYAEYAKAPVENCHLLNESLLLGKLGYAIEDIADISRLVVPYGGLRDINIKAGETVIIAPATGPFGSAAVTVALAMGARVIAMGRNLSILQRLAASHSRVEIVQITGDVVADTASLQQFGVVDAYFDISPPEAANSTHMKSAIMALRHGGRVSLMGGIQGDVAIPHSRVMHWDLALKGKWMYSREDVGDLIKMVEAGALELEKGKVAGKFGLEEWEVAFDKAKEFSGSERNAVIVP